MASDTMNNRGYQPGRLAKLSVVAAAGLYLVGLYIDARRGADLAEGAFVQLVVPFVLVLPAWLLGHFAYHVCGQRQRAGDVGFAVALIVECVYLAAAAHAG